MKYKMNWKQMTTGKKIAVGFRVFLTLLAIVGLLSYRGWGNFIQNAEEVIHGNELDGTLA